MVRGKVALLGWYSCWFYILLCACLILIYASLYFLLCRNLFNFIGNLFTENVNGTWRGCNIFPFPSFKCIMMQCQYGWIEQPKSLFLFVWEKPWYTVYKWYTKSGRTYKKTWFSTMSTRYTKSGRIYKKNMVLHNEHPIINTQWHLVCIPKLTKKRMLNTSTTSKFCLDTWTTCSDWTSKHMMTCSY